MFDANKVIDTIIGNYSKSEKVRKLHDMGVAVKDIAKALDISYNFAYNVVAEYEKQKKWKE